MWSVVKSHRSMMYCGAKDGCSRIAGASVTFCAAVQLFELLPTAPVGWASVTAPIVMMPPMPTAAASAFKLPPRWRKLVWSIRSLLHRGFVVCGHFHCRSTWHHKSRVVGDRYRRSIRPEQFTWSILLSSPLFTESFAHRYSKKQAIRARFGKSACQAAAVLYSALSAIGAGMHGFEASTRASREWVSSCFESSQPGSFSSSGTERP